MASIKMLRRIFRIEKKLNPIKAYGAEVKHFTGLNNKHWEHPEAGEGGGEGGGGGGGRGDESSGQW